MDLSRPPGGGRSSFGCLPSAGAPRTSHRPKRYFRSMIGGLKLYSIRPPKLTYQGMADRYRPSTAATRTATGSSASSAATPASPWVIAASSILRQKAPTTTTPTVPVTITGPPALVPPHRASGCSVRASLLPTKASCGSTRPTATAGRSTTPKSVTASSGQARSVSSWVHLPSGLSSAPA